ncbi:hypothetical protein HMPREF0762_00243 [Slackia exigua ATCC 700122]|uniref:Uncharacterized protein n=1 Tax=Slackia exigua (strain ATCC 700122 / DSM 15923 / CIP 105133 / JCM 11022 / KCTC 5966 / S-7) TaxID=649764 RepID=D0WEL3_SLAES|nr:hypothetical protein HMPREF0762_00243 [Slackia exigua ATCC 700122]
MPIRQKCPRDARGEGGLGAYCTVRFARTTGGSSGAAFCTERKRSHGQGIQFRRRLER